MLENPQEVEQYIKIKKEGVKLAKGNGEIYREHKKKFIGSIVEKALKHI